MIAWSFKSVGWVAAVGVAVLICYMLSLQVAAERAEVDKLERRIVQVQQSIRTLQTELGTRARVSQLQHWASADFAFAPPTAGQFLDGEVTLAALDVSLQPDAVVAPVMAQAPPTPPTPPTPGDDTARDTPVVVVRAAAPKARGEDAPRTPAVERALLHPASATPARSDSARSDSARWAPARQAALATASARPVARRAAATPPLLTETKLRELNTRSSAERAGARGRARPN